MKSMFCSHSYFFSVMETVYLFIFLKYLGHDSSKECFLFCLILLSKNVYFFFPLVLCFFNSLMISFPKKLKNIQIRKFYRRGIHFYPIITTLILKNKDVNSLWIFSNEEKTKHSYIFDTVLPLYNNYYFN